MKQTMGRMCGVDVPENTAHFVHPAALMLHARIDGGDGGGQAGAADL
jgi:hypothetical protein